MEENKKQNYISLAGAAKLCSYSEPYLRLRARQGKLKSIKLGKKWMTTAAWLDDYQARAQEWREAAEAKRANAPAAVFVAAPSELSANVDCSVAGLSAEALANEEIEPVSSGQFLEDAKSLEHISDGGQFLPSRNFVDTSRDQAGKPAAVFCADAGSLLPPPIPKRLRAIPTSGQIYPLPKPEQTRIAEISDYGWLGALISGAASALLLFALLSQSGVPNIINSNFEAGQASVSRSVFPDFGQNAPPPKNFENVFPAAPENFSAGDPLDELVEAIVRFFSGF